MHTDTHTHTYTLIHRAAHFAGQRHSRFDFASSWSRRRVDAFIHSPTAAALPPLYPPHPQLQKQQVTFLLLWHGAYESAVYPLPHFLAMPPNPSACECCCCFFFLFLAAHTKSEKKTRAGNQIKGLQKRWMGKDCLRRKEIYFSDILT